MRRELVTGCTVSRYEPFETFPETIDLELRPAVCEQRQTDIRRITVYIVFDLPSSASILGYCPAVIMFHSCLIGVSLDMLYASRKTKINSS